MVGRPDGPAVEYASNLPAQLTSLVGRDREVDAAQEIVRRPDVRLLTLTGPGGVGKTRLGIRVAKDLAGEFPDGVCFVSLAPLVDPDLLPSAIARSLGLKEAGERPLQERLKDHLRTRHLLLLLDNFEHVTRAAPVVTELLRASPSLKVLVTSRAVLHLSGEFEVPVPPLDLPDPVRLPGPERLARYEAVNLFVERARAASPDFALSETNAAAVAEICLRLDGLPLAIELAAARIKVLPPEALLARLEKRLPLLTGGPRDLPSRQRTLGDAILWSHDLLGTGEQRMFRRFAIFAGGCTLHAAEAVCATTDEEATEVLDDVASLVDKNLLRRAEQEGREPRFAMLETIREYALERLSESGEDEAVRSAHAGYYLALAQRAEPELTTAGQMAWLHLLEREHDNLRAALRWSLRREDAETTLRLCGALWRFWYVRGYLSEGRRWIEEALALEGGEPSLRAKVLGGGGELAHSQGDLDRAQELREEALALSSQLEDETQIAASLNGLAFVIRRKGEFARARAMHGEALELYRKLDDEWGVGRSTDLLGRAAAFQGDFDAALPRLEEGLRTWRSVGDRQGIAESTAVLGMVALGKGDYKAARPLLQKARDVMAEMGDPRGIAKMTVGLADVEFNDGAPETALALYQEALLLLRDVEDKWWISWCLEGIAEVAVSETRPARAATLFGAAAGLREAIGAPRPPGFLSYLERDLATARDRLDEPAFAAAWEEGRAMNLEEAIAYALGAVEGSSAPPAGNAEEGADGTVEKTTAVRLRIFALGPARVEKDQHALANSRDWVQKSRELLYYLLCHPEGRTKEQIGLALWPEASTAQLRSSFHDTVFRLRRALGAKEWISFAKGRYAFGRSLPYSFDVEDFQKNLSEAKKLRKQSPERAIEHLQEATNHYAGDFLEDFAAGEWAMEKQEELRHEYQETLLLLGQLLFAQRRHVAAVETYRQAITHDRFLEEAHRGLMRAQAAMGERGRALRHYEELCTLLEEHLDAAPAPETTHLYRRLRGGGEI